MNKKYKYPNFLIAGSPRCGTSWLSQVLDRHDDIYLAKPFVPEPKFFLVDELYRKGFTYYLDTWFAAAQAEKAIGEKSTNYLENPKVAERIAEHLPDIKLIFMLRNPVDRAFSNWLWSRSRGYETESFENSLKLEKERGEGLPEELHFARPHAYFSRGLYKKQLQTYYNIFPKDQILCINMELFFEKPKEGLEKIFRFLNVENNPKVADGFGVINSAENELSEVMRDETRFKLTTLYEHPNQQLKKLLGDCFTIW